jgi:hypothetical protein
MIDATSAARSRSAEDSSASPTATPTGDQAANARRVEELGLGRILSAAATTATPTERQTENRHAGSERRQKRPRSRMCDDERCVGEDRRVRHVRADFDSS